MAYSKDYLSQKFLEKPKISDLEEELSGKIFSLLKINKDLEKKAEIRIIDEVKEDHLLLIHYFTPEEEVQHIRGIVVCTHPEPRILAQSFPFTQEHVITSNIRGADVTDSDVGGNEGETDGGDLVFELGVSVVTRAYEGTILRVFRGPVTGKWYLSTHRKINGEKSRWSGLNTFGEMFRELWGEGKEENSFPYEDYFLKDDCYIFLLSHPENRLASFIEKPNLRLVGKSVRLENRNMKLIPPGSEELKLEKEHPNVTIQNTLDIQNRKEMIEKLLTTNWKEVSGFFVYHLEGDGNGGNYCHCYKVILPEYVRKRELRNNEPNLKLRYLDFKMNNEDEKLQELKELFPEKLEVFDDLENNYILLPTYLKELYVKRYKKGDTSILPKSEHLLLENVRRRYHSKFTLEENFEYQLRKTEFLHVNSMIKNMIKNQK